MAKIKYYFNLLHKFCVLQFNFYKVSKINFLQKIIDT